MSITVSQFVLHQLIKPTETDENQPLAPFEIQLRQELMPINKEIKQMMLQLHQTYQSKNKFYAVFKNESMFAQNLNKYLEKEQDFLVFSQNSAQQLSHELSKYHFTESGTLVLCNYHFLATEYLLIALLDTRSSMLVDENLNIQRSQYLDINQFDMVARINLTELKYEANSKRYLTCLQGRIGRKVADFFMDFLGGEESFNAKVQNQCLLQAVNDYCDHAKLDHKQSSEIKKQVFDYCKGQIKTTEEIELNELSSNMPVLNAQPFVDFVHQQDYGLAEHIPPVSGTLKHLTKFNGSGKGITLSFEATLLNERIFWNDSEDTLTIKGLPPNLRDQLQRRIKTNN